MSLDDWLARRPPSDASVVEEVLAHLDALGPVEVEAVPVGILVRGSRTFVELRPRRTGIRLSVVLPHDVQSRRVQHRVRSRAGWTAVFVDLESPDDVDEEVRAWLTESYEEFAR